MYGAAGLQEPQLPKRSENSRETMGFIIRRQGSLAAETCVLLACFFSWGQVL